VPKKYKVTLSPEERRSLEQMVRSGKTLAPTLTRARVLLKADCAEWREGWTNEQIVETRLPLAAAPGREARCLARKLGMHYTPKRGSWLNMAEIELSALARQCLKRRLASEGESGGGGGAGRGA